MSISKSKPKPLSSPAADADCVDCEEDGVVKNEHLPHILLANLFGLNIIADVKK